METGETRDAIIKRRNYRNNVSGDASSLYISSYPVSVMYLKNRIGDGNKTLAELCCGVGMTLEHIGDAFRRLIGVDVDKNVLSACSENLEAVGLLPKTTLVCGDITDDVLRRIKADIVIYDVPFWGLPENGGRVADTNPSLKKLIRKIRKYITSEIVVYCPPNYDYDTVLGQAGKCEYQKIFINGKYDRNYVYLGSLIHTNGITRINLSAGC
ncbi:MAG: methyltransferase domain-containing protein [Candidatus Aenigmarchaeota archaeon]|nr:methyltransferase domain-containing protein [Candidatus Aenigmarchaeota archaeon]